MVSATRLRAEADSHCRKSRAYFNHEIRSVTDHNTVAHELTGNMFCFPSGDKALVTISWLCRVSDISETIIFQNSHLSPDGVPLTKIATKI